MDSHLINRFDIVYFYCKNHILIICFLLCRWLSKATLDIPVLSHISQSNNEFEWVLFMCFLSESLVLHTWLQMEHICWELKWVSTWFLTLALCLFAILHMRHLQTPASPASFTMVLLINRSSSAQK